MKIDAIGVSSSNLKKTVEFYSLLGFQFPEFKEGDDHLEPVHAEGTVRLMIDSAASLKEILREEPRPGNTSSFAILFETPDEVNHVAAKVKQAGFEVVKEPWDAFWGQHYAVVVDPDGYKVDLFAAL